MTIDRSSSTVNNDKISPMNVHIVSLGCARNLVDSEVMTGKLRETGCIPVQDPEDAEVIIVNTCSFIEAAANESI
ncbi:MAG: 30S ribosomal protein S12 methylthiotransferase RimO, partial [Deltaproteobacteria bacterium]